MFSLQDLANAVTAYLRRASHMANKPLKVHAKGLKAGDDCNFEFKAEDDGTTGLYLTPAEEPEEGAAAHPRKTKAHARKGKRHGVPAEDREEVREADGGEVGEKGE